MVDVTSGEATAAGRARWFELRRPIAWVRNVDVLVYTGTFIWGALFAAAAMLEQHFFVLRRYDLGNFTQAIWSRHTVTSCRSQRSEVPTSAASASTSTDSSSGWCRSGGSGRPPISCSLSKWSLALGAFPLYWLGRRHLPSRRDAAFVATAYLVCPAVAWSALGEFDAIVLAVPLLLLGIWFLDENRLWAFAAVAALAVLCQEQVGLIVACRGVVDGFRSKRARARLP